MLLIDEPTPVRIDGIDGPETPSKRRLISAGERLLGERGFNGVALHEIAFAAGQANKYAVQYHFGGLEGLIKAIFTLRLRWIDRRREALLDRTEQLGLLDSVPALLEALFVPLAEQVDEDGRHSYARFWLQYFARPDHDRRSEAPFPFEETPTERLFAHLAIALSISVEGAADRYSVQAATILMALIDRDNGTSRNRPAMPLEVVIARAINSVSAALQADLPFPGPPSSR